MGLLSNPETKPGKWVKRIEKLHVPLCYLLCISSAVWFVMLANKNYNNGTYFSENALLPGLVRSDFDDRTSVEKFYSDYINEIESQLMRPEEIPVAWLVSRMSSVHLEVHVHNFTLHYPLLNGRSFKGNNVYGILRAPRTASVECIVITVPYRSVKSHYKGTAAGLALMLAFAKFARPQKYWAKDIIFLVTEHEQLGVQAWLEAYHGVNAAGTSYVNSLANFWMAGDVPYHLNFTGVKCLDSGVLTGRSGAIQAAINLEIHSPKIKFIEVKIEGLNGQLPNLDLVNLVHKMCEKSGVHHSFKGSYSWFRRSINDEWYYSLKTMIQMLLAQASGVPNGNHGLFHRYGIEAVTLEGCDPMDMTTGETPRSTVLNSPGFERLAFTLEGILRSLNNLLERFHQSYFFYIMTSYDRFISIGQYMPCLCLLCGALLIRSLGLWYSINKSLDNAETKANETKTNNEMPNESEQLVKDEKTNKVSLLKATGNNEEKADVDEVDVFFGEFTDETIVNYSSVGWNYFIVHLIGYCIMNTPVVISNFGATYTTFKTQETIFYSFTLMSLTLAAFYAFSHVLVLNSPRRGEICLTQVLVLIELATLCLVVGMNNFSLGLIIALMYTPFVISVAVDRRPFSIKSWLFNKVKQLIWILVHPLSVLIISTVIGSYMQEIADEFTYKVLKKGYRAAQKAIVYGVVDSMIYGNWVFNVATSFILPIWLLIWQVLTSSVNHD